MLLISLVYYWLKNATTQIVLDTGTIECFLFPDRLLINQLGGFVFASSSHPEIRFFFCRSGWMPLPEEFQWNESHI